MQSWQSSVLKHSLPIFGYFFYIETAPHCFCDTSKLLSFPSVIYSKFFEAIVTHLQINRDKNPSFVYLRKKTPIILSSFSSPDPCMTVRACFLPFPLHMWGQGAQGSGVSTLSGWQWQSSTEIIDILISSSLSFTITELFSFVKY